MLWGLSHLQTLFLESFLPSTHQILLEDILPALSYFRFPEVFHICIAKQQPCVSLPYQPRVNAIFLTSRLDAFQPLRPVHQSLWKPFSFPDKLVSSSTKWILHSFALIQVASPHSSPELQF